MKQLEKNRKRQKAKKFSQYEAALDPQLRLFNLSEEDDTYSHTIELYDFMPKYFWGKVERVEGRFLDPIKRNFECRGKRFNLTLIPARIEVGENEFKDYFPGRREELVEDALRKLMTEGHGVLLDGEASVTFTLYQLQKELKEKGHSYSRDQLKQALQVLFSTDIYLNSADNQTTLAFSPIETLGFKGSNSETHTFVRFSPLVTESIKKSTFRLFNYDKVMTYKSVIARQLHKRMAHHFTQASLATTYEILLSTLIRDFGLTRQKKIQDNLKEVHKALVEMYDKNVILQCKAEQIVEGDKRTRIVDFKLSFMPHPEFINDAKRANAKAKESHRQHMPKLIGSSDPTK